MSTEHSRIAQRKAEALSAVAPHGVLWTCSRCGQERETPARVIPESRLCSDCRGPVAAPVAAAPPGVDRPTWTAEDEERLASWDRAQVELDRSAFVASKVYAVGKSKRLSAFDETMEPEAYAAAVRWSGGEGPLTLALIGGPGCGKSHLLLGACWEILKRDSVAFWWPESVEMVARYLHGFGPEGKEARAVYRSAADASVLILEDLGRESARPDAVAAALCQLLDERGARALGWASNLGAAEIGERYGTPLASRLLGSAEAPVMVGEDYRAARAATGGA